MGNISVSLPSDGETIDAADYNTPINTIVNEINGELDNSNIASDAAIAGSKLADASITNAKLSTTTGELGGAWDDWTPSLTNLSGGTLNYARYTTVGKTIKFRFKYTLAGAGVSGNVTFSLPTAMHADYDNDFASPFGSAVFIDDGVGSFTGVVAKGSSSTTVALRCQRVSGSNISNIGLSSTVPFTWANNDVILAEGSYEAA